MSEKLAKLREVTSQFDTVHFLQMCVQNPILIGQNCCKGQSTLLCIAWRVVPDWLYFSGQFYLAWNTYFPNTNSPYRTARPSLVCTVADWLEVVSLTFHFWVSIKRTKMVPFSRIVMTIATLYIVMAT